ncbi:hypothetical protein NIES73_16300 [Sphaerospermopsis kisseleviana NIES-73]|nr:hypothetical protein NIES73_16300 [Sphaerospermopsis kisseleviana NIES-73]
MNWSKTPISLDKELEQITATSNTEKRYADKLYQVWLLDNTEIWILIHIEVQSQYDEEFSQRMYIYNYRSFDLYHKPVVSLAILGDESKTWRPNCYQYGLGNSEVVCKFDTVKLIDYKWEELEQSSNLFAILVMAHLKTKTTTNKLADREQWKWQLIRSLYERGLSRYDIENLFRFIDKMMSLTKELQQKLLTKITEYEKEREMPFLTPTEELFIARTNQQNILKLLQVKFGDVPEILSKNIQNIDDLTALEELLISTMTITSLEEFTNLVTSKLPTSQE